VTGDPRAYLFEKVLMEQPKKGVTLFLATPLRPDTTDDQQDNLLIPSGERVVIKVVPHPSHDHPSAATTTSSSSSSPIMMVDDPLAEIGALQLLQQQPHHPNTIHLLDSFQDQDFLYMVLPYLSGGDLFQLVEEMGERRLPEATVASYITQMASGLLMMKQNGLAHHDVSLENVSKTSPEEDQIKIIDLGMCLHVPRSSSRGGGEGNDGGQQSPVYLKPQRCRGKPSYLSPQIVREESCDPYAADVWSLGVCL